LLYIEGQEAIPDGTLQGRLTFSAADLADRYQELAPQGTVSLITVGCPQASIGELRAVAELLQGQEVRADPATPGTPPPLWIFTSSHNKAIAEKLGLADAIRKSGALLLENTCPEVVPYDRRWVRQILTNSMKAEHYIKSGLNGIPTAVMNLADCIAVATGEKEIGEPGLGVGKRVDPGGAAAVATSAPPPTATGKAVAAGPFVAEGQGLPSQGDFRIQAEAFVTDTPITLLGFVNRETGVIEEEGHPANGQSMAGKIAVFPRGTGSTVAPYVLLELYYRGRAPLAIANTDIDQQSAPACSLEKIPYAYAFDGDIIANVNSGDLVELSRSGEVVRLRVLERAPSP
jgi:predicted aconitase with swiveling domain